MAESISNFVNRQFQRYDTNRNGVLEATPIPILKPVPEVGGRVGDYFARNSALSGFGVGVMDGQTLANDVYRDIDMNKDGQIGFFERIIGFIKTGMY